MVDSSSCFDLIDEAALTPQERKQLKHVKTYHMITANGPTTAKQEVSMKIDKLGKKSDVIVMKDAP